MTTYRITVECKTKEERDEVLNMLDDGLLSNEVSNSKGTISDRGVILFGKSSNVFFSEMDEDQLISPDELRVV